MKIGMTRQEKATEVYSVCSMETFWEKVKKETKGKFISQLRETLPSLQGSEGRFIHLDKIPRVYPVAEYRRTADGWKFKRYNDRAGGGEQPFGTDGNGICEAEGGSPATDACGIRGLQRKEREDMGAVFLAQRLLAHFRRTGFALPRPSLPGGGAMLPAALPLPRHTEGAFAETELPHDGGRNAALSSRCGGLLHGTTHLPVRRDIFP